MKRSLIAGLVSIISVFGVQGRAAAEAVSNEVVVKFKPGVRFTDQTYLLRRTMGLKTLRVGYLQGHIVVEVPKGSTQENLIRTLGAHPSIQYAEPNYVVRATAVEPNDLYYSAMQWNLQSIGGYGIGCDNAWALSTGAGVPVAVLDTGCAYETRAPYFAAPDLNLANILPLSDWVNGDIWPHDDNGHGTFLCSLIAARMNNRMAGTGIAPDVRLLVGKVLDESGVGRADWLANGIREATDRGASIILLGGGTQRRSRLVQDAIDRAAMYGVAVVMGAGNQGVDLDLNPNAWAIYDRAVVVGASTRDGNLAPYSNYSSRIRLVAPGGTLSQPVWSHTFSLYDPVTLPFGFLPNGNSFHWMIGTSVAAAHAAGVMALGQAALGWVDLEASARPLQVSAGGQMRNLLLVDAARAVGYRPGSGGETGGGPAPGEIHDVGITSFTGPSAGVQLGNTAAFAVAVRNYGTVGDEVMVIVRNETTGVTLDTQSVFIEPNKTATLTVNWTATSPVGIHTLVAEAHVAFDYDTTNNTRTRTVEVLPQPFAMRIGTYSPIAGDQANGEPQSSFRAGQLIGVEFLVTDNSAPAAGASVSFRVIGATGNTVSQGTLTTNGAGRATTIVGLYFTAGGIGTYRVEATATSGSKSTSETYTFEVTSTRSGR